MTSTFTRELSALITPSCARVAANTPDGSALNFHATVQAADGRHDDESRTVTVRNR